MKSIELRKDIISALLLAIGFVFHTIVPGFVYGVKPDFMLAFMFLAVIINPTLKNTFLVSTIGGFLTAMTTNFPGGQIPNVIDKIVTLIVVFILLKLIGKFVNNTVLAFILGFLGTLMSGTVFLISALVLVSLPAPFKILFFSIVLPTALMNFVFTPFIYIIYKRVMNLSKQSIYN